jgi:DNA-binding transcriptional regulator YhcF (GntR family)
MSEIEINPHTVTLILEDFSKAVSKMKRFKGLTQEEIMSAFCLGMIAISQNLGMSKEEIIEYVKDFYNTLDSA